MSAAAWLPLAGALARARFPQTTGEPATEWMRSAGALLDAQAPWVVVAFVVVQGLLLLTVLRLGARPAATPEPPTDPARGPGRLGPLWTLGPAFLIALLALPVIRAGLRQPAPAGDALRVAVIGHQWWWEFRYPDQGFATATDVHVPLGRAVRFEVESADVMHSLWIPAMGPRQDVFPLRRRDVSFVPDRAGVFPGQCAELCGASHAHMHLRLFVDSPGDFADWLAGQLSPRAVPPDSLTSGPLWHGQQVFVTHACRGCHTVRGLTEGPVGPDLTHFASRGTIAGGMFERNDSTLARWILHANTLKQGSSMPGFPVPARDLGPLVTWLQSLR